MTAGYSGTPLWKKLGFTPEMRIAVLNAPPHYAALLAGSPGPLTLDATPGASDAIHFFMIETAGLGGIALHARHLPPARMLWVSWPKLSSPLSKGLREDDIRKAALGCGLVDIKVCAVDQDWSGLKLVRRKV